MLKNLRQRIDRELEGFTLIELMVVVLIIAILIAIAVPTFLGARGRAQARQAQSNLRNAFSAEKAAFTDAQTYVVASRVQLDEPSLSFHDTTAWARGTLTGAVTTSAKDVNLSPTPTTLICMAVLGADGNYYALRDVANTTAAGRGTSFYRGSLASVPACNLTTAIRALNADGRTLGWFAGW